MLAFVCAGKYECGHVFVYLCVQMFVYVCMCACMWFHVFVCMCVCIRTPVHITSVQMHSGGTAYLCISEFVCLCTCMTDSLVLVCVQQSCVAMCTCPPWVCVCEQQVPITTVSEELDRYPRCSFWNCSCWLLVHMRTVCGSPGLYLCTHRGEVVCLPLCFYMLLGGPRNVNLLVMSQKLLRVCHFMFHLLCQLDTKLLYIV